MCWVSSPPLKTESHYKNNAKRTKRCSRIANELHAHFKVGRGNRLILVVLQ